MISLSESSGRVTDSKSASVLVPFAPGHNIDGFLGASSRAVSRRQARMPISAMAARGGRRSIPRASGAVAGRGQGGCPDRLDQPDRRCP
jgi:hypothetical protein